jgi:uncharacterized protein (TIGR02266 family)
MEKRVHPRVALVAEVDVASGNNFFVGRTRDLSVGGLFIETDVQIDVGAPLTVELDLQKKRFRFSAEVVWTLVGKDKKVVGVGVRFISLSPPARKAIEDFMKLREPLSFEMDPESDD